MTANTAIPITVNGAKELKQYIQDVTCLTKSIRDEFERDLTHPSAVVNYTDADLISVGRGNHEFNARKCRITHNDFVYNQTQLPQYSNVIQTENVVKECLVRLEGLRKMLVNNKQQKKTTIRNIRRIISDTNSSRDPAHLFEEITYQSPRVIMLRGLIEQTKQNHKTVTRNILDQVRAILLDMRTRYILMFERAVQQTVEAIIHHAEKCRTFIAKCRHLAMIEYCASSWWMETQKDPNDQTCYYVSALLSEDHGELKQFNPVTTGLTTPPMNVEIFVHEDHNNQQPDVCVMMYKLDEELAAEILTDDAIHAFEDEERNAKLIFREHQRQYDEEEIDDDDQVWNYWSHPDEQQHGYAAAEQAWR